MSSLFENFASKVFGYREKANRAVFLGAFGKHPGWDDHIDDFGLESEPLLAARQFLYVNGVGGAIDSAVWDKLAPEESLAQFRHVFSWSSEPDLVIGRMWASSDRKGRSRYPMVICAHVAGFHPETIIERVLHELAQLELECRATQTVEGVHLALESTRERLRKELLALPESPAAPVSVRLREALEIGLEPENEAWTRSLYAIENQLVAFGSGKIPEKQKRIGMRLSELAVVAQHLRLPGQLGRPAVSLAFWQELVTFVLATRNPLLLIQPIDEAWVDLIVGAPGAKQLFCLKASAKALPTAPQIPYNLPEGFRPRAAQIFRAFTEQSAKA